VEEGSVTTFLVMILAVLMILVGVALIAFDIFARVFNNMYSRMFLGKRSGYGYGYGAVILLVLLYFVMKSSSPHH
jgi:hypothetical protein